MGCINSTKKVSEIRNDNVFRVLRLHQNNMETGFLELTPKELIFSSYQQNDERIIWALQHLRRYGLTNDVFSFEAGRRCMTGPGIYTFRCQNADQLYHLFQRYVNAVSVANANEEIFIPRDFEHPSHTLGRPDQNPQNNYLEPAPMGSGTISGAAVPPIAVNRIVALQESFSSSPLSLLDSPDSVPSLSFTNEVVHFGGVGGGVNANAAVTGNQHNMPTAYANSNNAAANGNVYLEHPLRSQRSSALNSSGTRFFGNSMNCVVSSSGLTNARTAFGERALTKNISLDAPPEECAPMLIPAKNGGTLEALHMYSNVEPGIYRTEIDPTERCYENLSRADLPFLLQSPLSAGNSSQREDSLSPAGKDLMPPLTPGGVNYIILDLDQPRSPAQISPKNCFGSGLSLLTGERSDSISLDLQSPPPLTNGYGGNNNLATTPVQEEDETQENDLGQAQQGQSQQQHKTESSLGYSTIDFIKTCALNKSVGHDNDDGDDTDEHDQEEESRITRHSKCVRKAFSVSE